MTISEYYNNYKENAKYAISLNSGYDKSLKDFYNNCISQHFTSKKENILKWHKMFMEYVDRPDAILWIRYYENGAKNNGRWKIRRSCVTEFKDGFTYAFVSNYDVHEIYNMISLGVEPDVEEFAKMMRNRTFPFHYDNNRNSSEEGDITSYPNIGSVKAGVLNAKHWYLAHINGIKSAFVREDGRCLPIILKSEEGQKIYPLGELEDWQLDKNYFYVRKLNYSLSDYEKKMVRAHFLRFVDPLNYYPVPGLNFQKNDVCAKIWDYDKLNIYISNKFDEMFGLDVMNDFRKKALICLSDIKVTDEEEINIEYGVNVRAGIPNNLENKHKNIIEKKSKKMSDTHNINKEITVGQYAKKIFTDLLEGGKLDEKLINNLRDKSYCSKVFGVSFPILASNKLDIFDIRRYYKNYLVLGEYLITSEWYDRNKLRLDWWLAAITQDFK